MFKRIQHNLQFQYPDRLLNMAKIKLKVNKRLINDLLVHVNF